MRPETRLAELRSQIKAEHLVRTKHESARPHRKQRLTATSLSLGVAKIVAITALPFLLYVRASVFFYTQLGGAPWVAVAGALTLTLLVVAAHATWIVHGVFGKSGIARLARWVVAPMLGGWLVYSLLFLARVNAKSGDVATWYSSLHPVLRVAVSTAIIVDPNVVITDMQRVPSDYGRMRLPVNRGTRHYMQADGWVYAVDLRTLGRGEVRNRALQLYFWATGFSTLRHVGTADHLHVQLRLPDRPLGLDQGIGSGVRVQGVGFPRNPGPHTLTLDPTPRVARYSRSTPIGGRQ